mgnify:CR=1 FL=1
MIQTVVKRDGRVVGFNEEKIIAAIRRAMLHTALGEDRNWHPPLPTGSLTAGQNK